METWLRITLVVVAGVWSIVAGMLVERRLHRRLVRLGGASIGRGLLVGVGYPLLNLLGYLLWGLVVALIAEAVAGQTALIVALFLGLLVLGPFAWCLMSPASEYTPTSPATVAGELREHGAATGAARAMGIAGAICSLLFILPGLLIFGTLILTV